LGGNDGGRVVTMVARYGGIVGSDGSMRERGGEGDNNKKIVKK